MPWTAKQNKVWRAIEHGWNPPGNQFSGITPAKAKIMAHEGIKASVSTARKVHGVRRAMKKKH